MHEDPPQKPPSQPDNVIDFAKEKEKRGESGKNHSAAGGYEKKLGRLKRKKGEKFSRPADQGKFPEKMIKEGSLEDIVLIISEYQFKFLEKLNFLVPMSKRVLDNLGEKEFLKETADIRQELYDWEKKLETAYKNLQKISGEKSLLETVRGYLDNFKICGLGQHDSSEDENEAAKVMKKLEDFVGQNK